MRNEILQDEDTLIIQGVTLIMFFCLAALGNGVLIFAYVQDYRMRTATNMLVVSHISAEFSFSILGICVYSVTAATRSPLRRGYCTAYGSTNIFFFYASLLSLTSISIDRFLAVVKQVHHRITTQHIRGVLVFIWIQALVSAVPWDLALVGKPGKRYIAWVLSNCEPFFSVPNHGNKAVNVLRKSLLIISFILPVLTMWYTSFHILRSAIMKRRRVHVLGTIVNNHLAADAYSKSAFTTVIIIAVYFLCMVPSVILYVDSKVSDNYKACLRITATAAMSFRSVCYPFIFAARNRNFSAKLRAFFVKRLSLGASAHFRYFTRTIQKSSSYQPRRPGHGSSLARRKTGGQPLAVTKSNARQATFELAFIDLTVQEGDRIRSYQEGKQGVTHVIYEGYKP